MQYGKVQWSTALRGRGLGWLPAASCLPAIFPQPAILPSPAGHLRIAHPLPPPACLPHLVMSLPPQFNPCLFSPCPLPPAPGPLPPAPGPRPPARSLYVSVITTIRGYGDFLWVDVVEKIDAMASQVRQLLVDGLAASEMAAGGRWQAAGSPVGACCCRRCTLPALLGSFIQVAPPPPPCCPRPPPPPCCLQVNEFQAQCKRLPKALRDWPAYRDCRATIDDFLDLLPLFQALTHRAIRDRSCLAELGLAGAGAWAGAGLTRWTGWWAVEQGSVQAAASSLPACLPAHPARSSRCSSPPTPSPTRRHWAELMSLTGRQLNLAEDVFKLQHLLDANMLARRCGGSR